MKRLTKAQIFAPVLILTAISLRLLYLWQFSESPLFNIPIGPDVEEYDKWAKEILAWGFSSQRLHIHAPLYPMFLAFLYNIFSFKLLWIRLVQTLIILGGFGFLSWTIQSFVAPQRRAIMWIFLAFAAFYPPLLFYSSELISETLLLPLICLTISLLYWGESQLAEDKLKKGAIIIGLGGICAGLMAITHPISLLFIVIEIVLLPIITLCRKNKKKLIIKLLITLLFGLMAVLVIAPVCIRNSMIAKRFVLIQRNSGFNFYLGNNYNATGTCYVRPGKDWNNIHKWAEAGAAQRGITKEKFFIYMSLKFIYSNPLEEAKLLGKKALYVWNFRELTAGADSASLLYYADVVRSGKYLFILLGALSICGVIIVLCKRETIFKYRHFLLLILAYWAAQTITVTSGRYRLPMYPAFFVFAAFAVNYMVQCIKERKHLVKYGIVLLCAILIVTIPSPLVNEHAEQAEVNSLYGEAYFKQGKYQEATKYLQEYLQFDPADARVYNLLGIIAEATSPGLAMRYYRKAIESEPDAAEGYLNLAIQYSHQRNSKEAEIYFSKALQYGSDNPSVLYNYACFMQGKGDIKNAIEYLERCLIEAPWDDKALNTLGVIYVQKRNFKLAIKYLLRAHKVVPNKIGVMLNLTVAYLNDGKKDEAIKMLNKILIIAPNNKSAKSLLTKLSP